MTSHHDVAVVVAELRDLAAEKTLKCWEPRHGDWMRALKKSADLLESQAKALSEAEANLALLSDPISVHINMCRGTIAKPSWENLRHLFPVIYDLEHAERRRLAAEARLAEARKVIEPFLYAPITDSGQIIGLQREHFEAARAFTNAAKEESNA